MLCLCEPSVHISGLVRLDEAVYQVGAYDQRAPAALSGLAREVAISILAGDRRGLIEKVVSGGCITLHDALNGGRYQQIPAYDALDGRYASTRESP